MTTATSSDDAGRRPVPPSPRTNPLPGRFCRTNREDPKETQDTFEAFPLPDPTDPDLLFLDRPLRTLPIDVGEVAFAMDMASSGMIHNYVDRQTGEILFVSEDNLEECEEAVERLDAEPARYVEIPMDDSRAAYRDMEAFAASVEDVELQERLWRALGGSRPFRHFKDAVAWDGAVEERWFRYRDQRQTARAIAWLADEGLAPAE
jgi:hypothetical protein